jgi:hypothetical protein
VKVFLVADASGGTESKWWFMVLLAFSADGSHKLPPPVTGKCESPGYFKTVENTTDKMGC